MPKTTGLLETTSKRPLEVDIKEVPFVVRTVLGHQGWMNFFFDRGIATAEKRKQIRRAGLSRMLEHRLQIKWRELTEKKGVHLCVEIEDGDGHATVSDLKDQCLAVMKEIFGRAEEIKALPAPGRRTTHGAAKWADQKDLKTAGYVVDVEEQEDGLRLTLGLTDAGEPVAISPEDTIRHAAVGGPTGSGKTSRILIPQLLWRWKSSAICTEATAGDDPPDLYHKTSGFRRSCGHKIYSFNPDLLTSHRINPIDAVRTVDDAQDLANLIIENTNKKETGGSDPIWETSERHLLNALILHAAGRGESLADVRDLLTKGQDGMMQAFLKSPVEKAKSEYLAFFRVSTEGFRNGVISGVMMRLNLWVSPRIAALTKTTDVDMEALHHELFTFYLSVSAKKGHLKPLAALIFNYVLGQTDNDFDMPLFLCLDEFTNFGRIADFVNKMTIIRHRKIAAVLGFQDYAQLEKIYGRDDSKILWGQLGTKVMFKPNDLETARKISEMLGTETYYERTISSAGQIHEKEFGRPLMNTGDVLSMGDQKAIVFTPKTGPIMLKTYTWKDFATHMAIAPPAREAISVDEQIITHCERAERVPPWQKEWVSTEPPELNYIKENIADTHEKRSEARMTEVSPASFSATEASRAKEGSGALVASEAPSLDEMRPIEQVDSSAAVAGDDSAQKTKKKESKTADTIEDDPYAEGAII